MEGVRLFMLALLAQPILVSIAVDGAALSGGDQHARGHAMIQYRTSVSDQTSAIRHPICARCGVICPAGGITIYVPHPSGGDRHVLLP